VHGSKILGTVIPDHLPPQMQEIYWQLKDEAKQMIDDGVLELEGEAW
jgi:hypothetical protein